MQEDFCDLVGLIRSLQRLDGQPDCFGTAAEICGKTECAWREYCLHLAGRPLAAPEEDSVKINRSPD